jgi:hypothetical protein
MWSQAGVSDMPWVYHTVNRMMRNTIHRKVPWRRSAAADAIFRHDYAAIRISVYYFTGYLTPIFTTLFDISAIVPLLTVPIQR